MTLRRFRSAVALLFCCSCFALDAQAVALPFVGTLSFQLGNRQPISAPGSGTATLNGSGAGGHLTSLALGGGVFQATGITVQYVNPSTFVPFAGGQLTVDNGAGSFAGGTGTIPLFGVARLCAFGSCPVAIANLEVPLSVVGVGGSAFASGDGYQVTVVGAPWTTGSVAATGGATAMGFGHGPASATSSTAAASGTLQLVTPIAILTNIPAMPTISSFAVMTLHFVPEPATLVLATAAIGMLALCAQRTRPH